MGRLYELEYFALNFVTGEIELMKSDDYVDATDLSDAQKKVNMIGNPFIRLSGVFIESSKFVDINDDNKFGDIDMSKDDDEKLIDAVKALTYDQFIDWCETMLPDLDYLDTVLVVITKTKGLTKYKNALRAFIKNEREKLNKNGEEKS
jgi:hypothetical protein